MIDIILTFLCILLILDIYFLFRNFEVRLFCQDILHMALAYDPRNYKSFRDKKEFALFWFAQKYSYERYLFSFKALKLEKWFTKEELEKIRE